MAPGGGLAEAVAMLARHQQSLGHAVSIATLKGNLSPAVALARREGVEVVQYAVLAGYFSWSMFRRLKRLVKACDLVHLHSNWTFPVWWGGWLALRNKTPLVMSPRGCFDPVRMRHSAWKKRLVGGIDRALARRASLIHVTSDAERAWTMQFLARKDVPIAVISDGVELVDRSIGLKCESSKVRDFSNEVRTVLYLGRLHPLKGLDLLLAAWAMVRSSKVRECGSAKVGGNKKDNHASQEKSSAQELQNSKPCEWQLVIAGPDEQGTLAKLEKQAERLGLSILRAADGRGEALKCGSAGVLKCGSSEVLKCGSAEVLKCRPDILYAGVLHGEAKREAMQTADLFVLPTRSENFGIVVAEALACGVPVITTKGAPWEELMGEPSAVSGEPSAVSGEPSAVSGELLAVSGEPSAVSGRCGWWVDVGVDPLVEALRDAMSLTDEERRVMGENGRRLVERKYQWERIAAEMVGAYQRIVGMR